MNVIPIKGQTWLICGGRDFADQALFNSAMYDLIWVYGCPERIIHGGASGADMMANEWGRRHAIYSVAFTPQWGRYGKAAGPIRNQEMLDFGKPALVIAFPGGRGTADMVRRAHAAGLKVAEIVTEGMKQTLDNKVDGL